MDTSPATPAALPARRWLNVVKRTWAEASDDHIELIAAGVAFYGFLALVPLLAALVLAYGLLVDPAEVAKHMHAVTMMVPADAAHVIDDQLDQVVKTAATKKGFGLLLALILALYGAMKGAGAVVTALNVAFEVRETRGFVRTTLLNAAITIGAVLVAIGALLAASVTGFAQDLAAHWSPLAAIAVKYASWVAAAALASTAIAVLFRFAPDRPKTTWVWLTPGSIAATIGWIGMTVLFGVYAAKLGNYNATYGALGAVVVLLMWLYLSAYILLLAAELNSELARDAASAAEEPQGHLSREREVARG